jgi:hypothetical protein
MYPIFAIRLYDPPQDIVEDPNPDRKCDSRLTKGLVINWPVLGPNRDGKHLLQKIKCFFFS